MRKAEITSGIVTNVIVVDPDDVPDWATDWPTANDDVSPGWLHDGETFSAPPLTPEVIAERLAQALSSSALQVERAIAATRRAFVTDLPAQEMIYLAKEAEARAWQAASAPDLADYPFLAAEVGLTAATPADLAALWLTMAAQWRGVASQIEAARMTASAAIAAATTPAEAETAVAALQAALALIAAGANPSAPPPT